jgi:hypothetical protein
MAIKINKELTIAVGLQVPTGSVVVPTVHILTPVPYLDAKKQKQYRRPIMYDNFMWQSKTDYQNDLNRSKNIWTNEIPAGWQKDMTLEEFEELTDNGLKAEIWLMNYFNSLLGGNFCEIINATI